MNDIPKIIHYCWFGRKPLPKLAEKCIASWRKYLPDFEIKEWNEDNFDVNITPYSAEAYRAGKYAFVSDYARFWILYRYGGYYFDADVEIVAPLDEIIARGPFMGAENWSYEEAGLMVNPGLGMSCIANHEVYRAILDHYETIHFSLDMKDLETIVTHTTGVLHHYGLRNVDEIQQIEGIYIYPKAYFNPINQTGKRLEMKPETVAIHHYAASWMPWYVRFKSRIARSIGPSITLVIIRAKRLLKSD